MILFFDTETTGLPDFNKRARDPSQPHIVQLAALITDDAGKIEEAHCVIAKPDGWTIPDDVVAIHGITTAIATEKGIPEADVAALMFALVKKASLIVAYNKSFDKFLARILLRRCALFTDADDEWWKALPMFCTMRESAKRRKDAGGNGKLLKLTEAYSHIFGKSFSGAHDALADVTACKEVYFWLKKTEGVICERDGDAWLAHRPGHHNLQESDTGSSNFSEIEAINNLLELEGAA